MRILNDRKFVGILCLTLGLAPFYPEPHLLGKLRWIIGGAEGMQLMDWWDALMHGTPWLLAMRLIVLKFIPSKKPPQ